MRKLLLYIAAAALLISCEKSRPDPKLPDEVQLRASIVSSLVETKAVAVADAYTATVPSTGDDALNADVWFSSNHSGSYPAYDGVQQYGFHATISYTSGAYATPNPSVVYLEDETLYCVGLYPQNKWVAADIGTSGAEGYVQGGKAVLASGLKIDGCTDYMFAPQISGTSDSHFPSQTFQHIQTWLKIRVHSKNSAAGSSWGKIRKITVDSPGSPSINLATGAVTYSSAAADSVQIVAYDNETTGLDLSTESTEVGSIFVGAIAAGESLNFNIWADEYLKTVPVTLDASSSTAGKLYVATLSFAELGVIEGSATVSAWVDESQDLTGGSYTQGSGLVTGITLPSSVNLDIDAAGEQLKATIAPAGALNKTLIWSSSNDYVAKVNSSTGYVTPVATGVCRITARASDGSGIVSNVCEVTVQNSDVEDTEFGNEIYYSKKGRRHSSDPGDFFVSEESPFCFPISSIDWAGGDILEVKLSFDPATYTGIMMAVGDQLDDTVNAATLTGKNVILMHPNLYGTWFHLHMVDGTSNEHVEDMTGGNFIHFRISSDKIEYNVENDAADKWVEVECTNSALAGITAMSTIYIGAYGESITCMYDYVKVTRGLGSSANPGGSDAGGTIGVGGTTEW